MNDFVLKGFYDFSVVCSACNTLCESHYIIGIERFKEHDKRVCRDCCKKLTEINDEYLESKSI